MAVTRKRNPLAAVPSPERQVNSAPSTSKPVLSKRRKSIKLDPFPDPSSPPPNSTSTSTSLTSLHSCPNEILSHILKLAVFATSNPHDQQRQRMTNNAVCKAWRRFNIGANEYSVKGFKQTRRLARVMTTDEKRATTIKRLDIDLLVEDRIGTKQMVADLLARVEGLKELSILFLGRERYVPDAACLSVPLYDAFKSQVKLEEFKIFFRRQWTLLTLGGDLSRTLSLLPKLKRLDLPRVLVPKVDRQFTFTPSLTHLSMHIFDEGSLLLLAHLISTSLTSLLHLKLTVHEGLSPAFASFLPTLPSILSPISSQLLSFALISSFTQSRSKPISGIPLSDILASMTRITSLEIDTRLISTFTVLRQVASRIRKLIYQIDSEFDIKKLESFLIDENGLEVTNLDEINVVAWSYLGFIAASVSGKKGKLSSCTSRRGTVITVESRDLPTEEDDDDDESS